MQRRLFFFICAVFLLVNAGQVYAVPAIHFEEVEYDYGNVNQGETFELFFSFENRGDSVLVIKKLGST